ncbi:hypothetical protein F5884DRAFT_728585 [Xylogone sp. PMI_703]|nr:hypothetical protein F5884DRAFT_728585 [Xylogone sp. PMI_703]
MSLTLLSDRDTKEILHGLTYEQLERFQDSLRHALHEFSTGTQDEGACSIHQPMRTSLQGRNGTTTLFMPSSSSSNIGIKGLLSLSRLESANSASTTSDDAPLGNPSPQGALTIMSSTGRPFGFLNAEEVTAFRTALASSLLISRRNHVKTITVYGAGRQAFWHIRLCLLIHGSTIKHVHIINRTFSDRVRALFKDFLGMDPEIKEREGWSNTKFGILTPTYGEYARLVTQQLRNADIIICTTPSTQPLFDEKILTNPEGRRKGRLIIAIGSYKPHMIELPTEILTQAVKTHGSGHFHRNAFEGGVIVVDALDASLKEAGEIIQAGISARQLVELGELVMLEQAADESYGYSSTDSSDMASLRSSLEGLEVGPGSGKSLTSIFGDKGSLRKAVSRNNSRSPSRRSDSRRSSGIFHKRSSSGTFETERKNSQSSSDDAMCRWLSNGNVIYKSVGMGLMDLVVGADLIMVAREKGIGVTIPDF